MGNQVRVRVSYQIATYSGEVTVVCDENDESDRVKAMARNKLQRISGSPLPFGYESYKEVSRSYVSEDDDHERM